MARKISVEILGDSSSLVNAFRRSSREASRWNGSLTRATRGSLVAAVGFRGLGRSIAFASAAFVGGAGLTAAVKGSIEGFTKFEDQMQKTVGLANVAQGSVHKFSKEILALAPTVAVGPQELAKAFFFVASSGIKASQAMVVVKQSAMASISGLGDTATVADALTSVINAYGAANISAAQAADVLTATVREGKGEASQFAPVIGNVVALASQLGVSFDQVGAALAVQTRLGTDAEITAIQLQRVFSTLLKVTPKSAAAFDSVGLSADKLRETLGEKNGLIKVLSTVKAAFQGNTPALAAAFGDVRALRGILNLVGKQTKSTQEVFDKLAHSAGSASLAFKAVDKDSAQAFRKLKVSAQVAGIALGAIFSPVAVQIAKALTVATNSFTKFVNRIQAAKGFNAKINIVSTGLKGLGDRIGTDLLREFNKVDFAQVARVGSNKLLDALDGLINAASKVDWARVGQVIVADISTFLQNVNWVRVFKVVIKLMLVALLSQAKLFAGVGLEIMKQLDAGIRLGAKFALLEMERFGLELVKKIAGATSFLGHFDPFAGIKEKASRQLKAVQAQIDALHGRNIVLNIDVRTRDVGPGTRTSPSSEDLKSVLDKKVKGAASDTTSLIDTAAIARARATAAAKKAAAQAAKAKAEAQKAFQLVVDAFSLKREKASATKSLRDDLAVEKAFQAAILREISIEGKTTALEQQLFESIQNSVQINKDIAAAKLEASKARQFRALGLTDTGEQKLAGDKTLLQRTKNLRELVKGTPLDTNKTTSELNRIAKILRGKFGSVGREVRQAIVDMLNDIQGALDGNGSRKGPLTKTHGLNTKKIVDGLGLDEEQIKALRSRLSGFNTGGRALGAGTGETAARGATSSSPRHRDGGRPGDRIVVESNVTVNLDGHKIGSAVTRSQQQNDRRNPVQKRGPNRHR